MRRDFIEIGAGFGIKSVYKELHREEDAEWIFLTNIAESVSDKISGISVEPVKDYLDNLVCHNLINKINCGISNKTEESIIYYISIKNMIEYQLPSWLVGCASVKEPNPVIIDFLNKHSLPNLIESQPIKIYSISDFINLNEITEIDYLKIDTETEDLRIMYDVLWLDIKINKIQFESKHSNNIDLDSIRNLLVTKKYIELHVGHDSFFVHQSNIKDLLFNNNEINRIFMNELYNNIRLK